MYKFIYLKISKEHKILYLIVALFSLIVSSIGSIIPLINGWFIDSLLTHGKMSIIFICSSIMVFTNLLNLFIGYLVQMLTIKLTTNVAFNFNSLLIEHIKQLPLSYWKEKDVSYLNHRINGDVNAIVAFCFSSITNVCNSLITLALNCVIIFKMDVRLLLISLAFFFIYPIIYKILKKRVYKSSLDLQEAGDNFFASLNDQLEKCKFIKIHNINKFYKLRLSNGFFKYLAKKINYQKVVYLFNGCDTLIACLAQATLFIFGGYLYINDLITIGMFTIILSYLKTMMGSIRYFFTYGKSYQEANVCYQRIESILLESPESTGTIEIDDVSKISINDLTFYFDSKLVLNHFSFVLNKGNIYCIKGQNGAGKSTLCELLLGLFADNYGGSIIINNVNLADLNIIKYREHNISITEQEAVIFPGSILENVTLFQDVSFQELQYYITAFGIQKLIDDYPDKLNSYIDKNKLSGGEKQKISIIRQLLQNSNVMIFDEPTSALDLDGVQKLCLLLSSVKKDKIIIIISHDDRIANISDEIIYMPLQKAQ